MRPSFLFSEVWNGLRRNVSMTVSVVLVTMVSMYLLGLGLLAQQQAETMKGYWYDRVQVSIYLCTDTATAANCQARDVSQAEIDNLTTQLEAMPEVKQVFHETEQEAYDRFREQFPNSPMTAEVRLGDIPQSLRVQLFDPRKFAIVAAQFDQAPGVAQIQDQERVLNRFFTVINYVTLFAVLVAALMVVAAVLLIATTIRQSAYSRRREIGIMKLVGASNLTIRMPFLVETTMAALLGLALAVGMLYATVYYIFNEFLPQLVSTALIDTGDVWTLVPGLVGGVTLMALVTSVVTLWRSLRV